jgi:hypothetical protein
LSAVTKSREKVNYGFPIARETGVIEAMRKKLTQKEKTWIREYFKANGSATQATRVTYGGTPGACRVKGHKKLRKLGSLITEIRGKGFDQMKSGDIAGVDFYLGDMERRHEENEFLMTMFRHPRKFLKLVARSQEA